MLIQYKRTDMVFNYLWSARADHDNPKIIHGTDSAELNRSEGYEMLYFINSLAKTWNWDNVAISSYQHLERIIKNEVPSSTRTHAGIKSWIASHYQTI